MGYAIDGKQVLPDAAELNLIDGSIAGTQVAGKAVVTDSNVNSGVTKATVLHIGTSGSEVLQAAALSIPTLATIDDAAAWNVGRIYTTTNGDEYVSIGGVASTVAGDWLSFLVTSTSGSTTVRAIANVVGPLGIAVGALINTKFGWVQTAGLNLAGGAISGGGGAAGNPVYLTATAGLVDDAFVDGDMVFGAAFVVTESSAIAGFWLAHPTTNNLDIVS